MPRRIGIDARKLGDTGVGRYAQSLLAGLARANGADALDWTVYSNPHRWHHAESLLARTTRRSIRSGSYSPLQHLEFAALLAREPVDLLHAAHFTIPLLVPQHTRLVVTIHDAAFAERPDLIPSEHRSPLRLAVYRLLLRLAARAADLICADTAAAASSIQRTLPASRGKTRVLSPGVDVDLLARTSTTADMAHRDSILFVGTITARKGVRELIQAFHHSRPHRDHLSLVLVGSHASAYGRAMHALVRSLDLTSSVQFTGPISDDALLAWYRRARAVVLPSFLEGFGLPVVEAMAAGVPCVASDIPSIREVTAGAALLIPPGDAPALRDALDRACFDHPLRQELITRGHRRASAFSLERMGQAALALYQDVLGG
jgi:glycosyltransferase involved in cell wall biosynthesis